MRRPRTDLRYNNDTVSFDIAHDVFLNFSSSLLEIKQVAQPKGGGGGGRWFRNPWNSPLAMPLELKPLWLLLKHNILSKGVKNGRLYSHKLDL